MSVLDRLFGREKRKRLSKSVVEHDHIDEYVLRDLRDRSRLFDDTIAEEFNLKDGEAYAHSEQLKSDLFYALHTTHQDVRAKGADQIDQSKELNRQILSAMFADEKFRRLRARTPGNKNQAGTVVRAMLGELESALGDGAMDEHLDRANQMDQHETQLDNVQDLLDQLRQQARDAKEQGQDVPQDVKDQLSDAVARKQQYQQALAQLAQQQDQAGARMQAAVIAVAERASEKGEQIGKAYSELAGLEPGTIERMSADDAFKLAELWAQTPELRDLSRLAGRMKRDWRAKAARKVKGGREERIGIELGNDLSRVLTSELARSKHPILKPLFMQDFVSRSLLQHETEGEEFAALGPCIVAIDLSSSTGKDGRHTYEKAVAIGALANIHRDDRTVGVVTYQTAVTGTWLFPKNKPLDLQAVTAFATQKPSGGTAAQAALEWGLEVILLEPDFERADIILLTDGEDSATHRQAQNPAGYDRAVRLRETLTDADVRVFGVTVGIGPTAYTNLMCDEQVSVHQLTQPSPATDRLAEAIAA